MTIAYDHSRRTIVEASVHECARCGITHKGPTAPSSWGFEHGQGHLCEDCKNALKNFPQKKQGGAKRGKAGMHHAA